MEIKDNIVIRDEFCINPGPRYIYEGEWSGEKFLNEILRPKIRAAIEGDYIVNVDLDGVYGYPPSFTSGSFGVLSLEIGADLILKHIHFTSIMNPFNIVKIKKEIKHPKKKAQQEAEKKETCSQ